uniref:Uncharacterized protein n=1 Tax=Brassica campestris TaxID=3711 RepID=A0A3P5ZKR9_BRACM|nr:unnamed protein product [Brassica rapa]
MVLHAKRESAIIVRECGISSVCTPETAGSPNAQYPNAGIFVPRSERRIKLKCFFF